MDSVGHDDSVSPHAVRAGERKTVPPNPSVDAKPPATDAAVAPLKPLQELCPNCRACARPPEAEGLSLSTDDSSPLEAILARRPPHNRTHLPLEASALSLNTELTMRKDFVDGYPGPCIEWLEDQTLLSNAQKDDRLGYTIEFLDPRPDVGGLVRVGLDTTSHLRYSVNGDLRPSFTQAIVTLTEEEVRLTFPEHNESLVMMLTQYAVEALLPALRAAFEAASVSHNVPDDADLHHMRVPCGEVSTLLIHSHYDTARDTGCNVQCTGCTLM